MTRQSLAAILQPDSRDALKAAWGDTEAAADSQPLPTGEYEARIVSGGCATSRSRSTPSYKLTFEVVGGDYAGRRFWHDLWLTPAAIAFAKRDLGKLGITSIEQLDQPLPQGVRCKVKLALRRDDDGSTFNRVRSFEVVGIDKPEANPFAPKGEGKEEPKP
jgi:hypothetical protein